MYSENFNVIPGNGSKCVWMTSGIISYKLCSHNYLCEECLFDQVMHNECGAVAQEQRMNASAASGVLAGCSESIRLDGSLFYHKNHCWVKVVHPDEVTIGINGILAKLLYGIHTVVFPKIGETVTRDQIFAHIVQEKHIVPLIMPVTGVVAEVNSGLEKLPELLRTDYLGKGWLITIKPDNLEQDLRTLSFGSKAVEWYRAKDRSVRESIRTVYSAGRENLGPTMQDGGECVLNASEILTSEQYNRILDELSRTD